MNRIFSVLMRDRDFVPEFVPLLTIQSVNHRPNRLAGVSLRIFARRPTTLVVGGIATFLKVFV